MKRLTRFRRRGAMVTLVGFMMIVVVVMGAIAVDIAYVQLVNMQLRKATDAAAHAGAEALARLQDEQSGIDAALNVASQNTVLGTGLDLDSSDIELGRVTYFNGAWSFDSGVALPNAVRVNSQLRPNGYITTLGRLAGVENIQVAQSATAAHVTRDICLVLDRSGSMAFDMSGVDWSYPSGRDYCTDPHPTLSRWAAVVSAVDVFMNELNATQQSEKLALVTYATSYRSCNRRVNDSDINERLTFDYQNVTDDLDYLSNRAIIGGTAISAGIDDAVNVLTDTSRTRQFADKMVVLLTDGHENSGRSSLDAADDAAAENITIHTITFSDNADVNRMREVAERTGGQHFHAPDEEALIAIFQEIARGIPIVMTN
ncbi:MAG: VWA domain-containing protein [Planctomycetales bacterium]|nr:VWA domain-containing protein [Planctomycetales bacterium]